MMFGHSVRGSTDNLLQKVNLQLKGEKLPKNLTGDDDSVEDYLNSLNKSKKAAEVQWDKFGELSDLSASDNERSRTPRKEPVGAGNKFLKKKKPENASSPRTKEGKVSPKFVKSNNAPGKGAVPADQRKSTALAKASQLHTRYGRSTAPRAGDSDSDLDLSLSMDEEVLADVKSWKKPAGSRESVGKRHVAAAHKEIKKVYSPLSDDESSSLQIGKGGSKFLKKATVANKQPPKSQHTAPSKDAPVKKANSFKLASAEKYSTQVTLDTDEESMAEFMGNLRDASDGAAGWTPPILPKTPRGRNSPTSRAHSHVVQTAIEDDDEDSVSSGGSFKLNVMNLDDLEPAVVESPKKATKGSSQSAKQKGKGTTSGKERPSIFSSMGLHSVHELLDLDDLEDPSDASDIATRLSQATSAMIPTEEDDDDHEGADYDSDFESATKSTRPATPLKSILATTPRRSPTPRSARGRVRYQLDDMRVAQSRSRSPSPEVISTARGSRSGSVAYTDDFTGEDSIATEVVSTARTDAPPIETDYTEEVTSGRSSPERWARPGRRRSEEEYSDDFSGGSQSGVSGTSYGRRSSRDSATTYSDDYSYSESFTSTDRSRTPSPDRRVLKKMRSREVQTGLDVGLAYHWNTRSSGLAVHGPEYGMAFVDPTPIASTVITPEALEAMTAYSPCVVALQDLLRQQLQLTSQFVQMQKQFHQDALRTLEPDADFRYTTLEETKQYIKKKRKPILTFDVALKQVKEEMGLE